MCYVSSDPSDENAEDIQVRNMTDCWQASLYLNCSHCALRLLPVNTPVLFDGVMYMTLDCLQAAGELL